MDRFNHLYFSLCQLIGAKFGSEGIEVTQLTPQTSMLITDGPTCNEGYTWWKIKSVFTEGWVAEGAGNSYFITPTHNPPSITLSIGEYALSFIKPVDGRNKLIAIDPFTGLETIVIEAMGNPYDYNWRSDGAVVAASYFNDTVRLYDMNTGQITTWATRHRCTYLDWSPDDTHLLCQGTTNIAYHVTLIDVATGDATMIYKSTDGRSGFEGWSPDGSKLLLRACCEEDPFASLIMFDMTSGDMKNLIPGIQYASADWFANGDIHYTTVSNGSYMWRLNLETGETTRLGAVVGTNQYYLSPDGEKLTYFNRASDQTGQIFISDTSLQNEQQLTATKDAPQTFAWSHDGRYLTFASSRENYGGIVYYVVDPQQQFDPIVFEINYYDTSPQGIRWIPINHDNM